MKRESFVSTTNACKLCKPLGAALAFKGIEGCVPFLHGSQGCATYMRRYIISHYREPVDIASSSLGEKNAIYGGGPNLKKGLLNVMQKYGASVIGVASTCLTETIGDDMHMLLHEFRTEFGDLDLPDLVHVSTPSYSGTHTEGFHAAVRAMAEQLVTEKAAAHDKINIMPGMVSAEDQRHLAEMVRAFGTDATLLPDTSDTLDGPALLEYERIPSGGTPVSEVRAMSGAAASIELGRTLQGMKTAGDSLAKRFGVPLFKTPLPMGLRETDEFMAALESITGNPMPKYMIKERGRLVDALVDGHKYVFGKRAVVYGDPDMVIATTAFLAEIGVQPVLVATGADKVDLTGHVADACGDLLRELPEIHEGADFYDIAELAGSLEPELVVGNSKGYRSAREWNVPLIRTGFPIHDRFGGQRILHLGYKGAQVLYDQIVNAILEKKQSDNTVGYGYL